MGRLGSVGLYLDKMIQNLLDSHGIFNAGNDPDWPLTLLADFNSSLRTRPVGVRDRRCSAMRRCRFRWEGLQGEDLAALLWPNGHPVAD